MHSPHGQQVLSRFLHDFAGIGAAWTPANIADSLVEQVREQIGDGKAICGLSGEWTPRWPRRWFSGPSGPADVCVRRPRAAARRGAGAGCKGFRGGHRARLVTVDAEERFLAALSGVRNPEGKRKIIGREFIRAFEGAVRDPLAESDSGDEHTIDSWSGHAVPGRG